jgi:hypothetical protein
MRGCLRTCLGALALGALVTGIAYAGWRWGPAVFPRLEQALGVDSSRAAGDPDLSPGLAEENLDRFEAFRAGESGERIRFRGDELSSVLRYSLPGILPPGVEEPLVSLEEGRIELRARVAIGGFPELASLEEIAGLFPDTVTIRMTGAVLSFGDAEVAIHFRRVEAARIPLPARLIPRILTALGRADREGLPPEALAFPLPRGVASAFIDSDRLVLVADR